MRRPAAALALLALALAAGACGGDDDLAADDLDGRTFVATGAEGETLVADVPVTLSFLDGFLNLDGGCNVVNGAYDVDGDKITWAEQPFGTFVGCDEALTAQDEWLTALVADGAVVELDSTGMRLVGDDVTLELEVEQG